jgi:hypothetical protein
MAWKRLAAAVVVLGDWSRPPGPARRSAGPSGRRRDRAQAVGEHLLSILTGDVVRSGFEVFDLESADSYRTSSAGTLRPRRALSASSPPPPGPVSGTG